MVTLESLEKMVKQLSKKSLLSVDTETTSLIIHEAKLVGISLCASEGEAYYVPVGHHDPGDPATLAAGQLSEAVVRQHLKPLLEDERVKKIGQNLKYDMQIFRRWGVSLHGIASDTMIVSYLLDPDQAHNLDALALRHLHHKNISYEEVTGTGRSQISFAEVSIEKATEYSAEDADVAFRLNEKLVPQLEKLEMSRFIRISSFRSSKSLADMEYRGVLVDQDHLRQMDASLIEEISGVEKKNIRASRRADQH